MPIYEYGCHCGKVFELERRMSDRRRPAKCPKCGSKKSELLISSNSFSLKGGGWYATDYAVKGKKGGGGGKKK